VWERMEILNAEGAEVTQKTQKTQKGEKHTEARKH
jgi:hypothetical protein